MSEDRQSDLVLPSPPLSTPADEASRHALAADSLRPLSTSAWMGVPFGSMEEDQAARAILDATIPDPRGRRWFGKQVALGIVVHLRAGAITFDAMDSVMGISDAAFASYKVAVDLRTRCCQIGQDANRILGDFTQGGGETQNRWAWNDRMVSVLGGYHVVAWHRLAVGGHLPTLKVDELPSAWT